jgi:hypothetical protein
MKTVYTIYVYTVNGFMWNHEPINAEKRSNLDNENNESRKKVGQKLAFGENENPDPIEK